MAKTNSRGGRNNNPSGRNQYSDWGMLDMVRERPFAAAATAAGAAAAGLFLWSKRAAITDQLSTTDGGNDSETTAAASRSRRTATARSKPVQDETVSIDEVPAT